MNKETKINFFLIFISGQTALCAYFWKGYYDLLPLFIGFVATYIFLFLENKAMRIAGLATCWMWMVNGFLIDSMALVWGQVLAAGALVYSLNKIRKDEKEGKK